jgi:hypothetical protein
MDDITEAKRITSVTIPPEALEAAEQAMLDAWEQGEVTAKVFARAACLAMLKNWPGMYHYPGTKICLPLTEPSNDK